MEHVVFFPAPDGTPAFRRFAGIEDAVRFVEHLRNVENVSSASVYSLTEVPLSFKAWYRVEVPGEQAGEPAADQVPDQPVASAVSVVSVVSAGPATIAEAIESYAHPGAALAPVDTPESGSATGIVVPDQPLVAVDQFAAMSAPTVLPALEQPVVTPPAAVGDNAADAQVLEPAFGARRERGIGFFAR